MENITVDINSKYLLHKKISVVFDKNEIIARFEQCWKKFLSRKFIPIRFSLYLLSIRSLKIANCALLASYLFCWHAIIFNHFTNKTFNFFKYSWKAKSWTNSLQQNLFCTVIYVVSTKLLALLTKKYRTNALCFKIITL